MFPSAGHAACWSRSPGEPGDLIYIVEPGRRDVAASPRVAAEKFAALDDTLRAAGREPSTLVHSVFVPLLIGRDAAEVRRRDADLLRALGPDEAGDAWFEERHVNWIRGTPDEARATVARFAEAGAQRIVLQAFLPRDLDMIDLAAEALFGSGARSPPCAYTEAIDCPILS